ncbi:uncharacterized protein LOC124204396 [Daphnia pulex]|uniref:uncharacterized protein LOC124204396 n=1 Tax=Daphnia pulex TaxID=6669 RepID=UPI001EE13EC3|nr:uncharacterized protein LOC124204396 [Daphnia pulex]XP_046457408.1 uncharacterized protein LOC124204396 [Daphnia pulex]
MQFITPPSTPPFSFFHSWTISERQKIEERRRSNLIREVQLKTRHEKLKKNRQYAEATLERFKRNEALTKKELAHSEILIINKGSSPGLKHKSFHLMQFITPPSPPPFFFLHSWTISERQRIEERVRSNLIREVQLKTRHEKLKKNRQNAEATLERFKRNEALAKKELASFRNIDHK